MLTENRHQDISKDFRLSNPKQIDHQSDVELWGKFKNGDEASFIKIYNAHFDPMYQYGCQFTGNLQLVEDAIQDIFVNLRERRKNIVIKSSIKFYLLKSLKRKIIHLLEDERKKLEPVKVDPNQQFEVSFSVEQRLIESQLKKEQRVKLDAAIKKLTLRQREAIYYFYFENMTYTEIQEIMDFNQIQGVRNLIYRSLAHLKSNLTFFVSILSMPLIGS